jgi:hypothetical protein
VVVNEKNASVGKNNKKTALSGPLIGRGHLPFDQTMTAPLYHAQLAGTL